MKNYIKTTVKRIEQSRLQARLVRGAFVVDFDLHGDTLADCYAAMAQMTKDMKLGKNAKARSNPMSVEIQAAEMGSYEAAGLERDTDALITYAEALAGQLEGTQSLFGEPVEIEPAAELAAVTVNEIAAARNEDAYQAAKVAAEQAAYAALPTLAEINAGLAALKARFNATQTTGGTHDRLDSPRPARRAPAPAARRDRPQSRARRPDGSTLRPVRRRPSGLRGAGSRHDPLGRHDTDAHRCRDLQARHHPLRTQDFKIDHCRRDRPVAHPLPP